MKTCGECTFFENAERYRDHWGECAKTCRRNPLDAEMAVYQPAYAVMSIWHACTWYKGKEK